jgi:electron transport complex protein RnfE
MNKPVERLYNGLIKENPTVVLMLGMCPTLAVTTSVMNGLGMGLSTTVVLVMSNLIISALRKVIPDTVRMPAYIVIVASLVTIVQFLIEGFMPSLNDALGIYIPLIVVNCIILGRAEAYASKNPVIPSIFDGLGMGLGFSGISRFCTGFFRGNSSSIHSRSRIRFRIFHIRSHGLGSFFGFLLGFLRACSQRSHHKGGSQNFFHCRSSLI